MSSTRIGFILSSNSKNPLPSTRISVFNMFPGLVAAGYEPVISFEPPGNTETPHVAGLAARLKDQGIAIAYFQKVHGQQALAEAAACSRLGIKTVFGVCDLVDNDMAAATDATIVVTDFLKRLYAPTLRTKIHVVHDGIENPDFRKAATPPVRASKQDERISAVLVTSSALYEIPVLRKPPKFLDVTVIGNYPARPPLARHLREVYWRANALGDWRDRYAFLRHQFVRDFATINWNPETVHRLTAAADIAIIPVDMREDPVPNTDVSVWQVKSENRLTLTMALGMPVIASPVPAYLDVIEQGRNGFLATTRAEWLDCLGQLRNPQARQRIGENARASVIERYSMQAQARRLIAVLDSLRDPPVSRIA